MLNRRPRRLVNQMNVVPYIDVMLVLLVIFMVTTPLFTPGVIDVPSVSRAAATAEQQPLEVLLEEGGQISLKDGDQREAVESLKALPDAVLAKLAGGERAVAISASRELKYYEVIQVTDTLYKAGVKRVALTVKQGS